LCVASALLAWLLVLAAMPASLLLGPMIAAIGFGASGIRLRLPAWTFIVAQGVIGCLVASVITPPVLVSIARAWPLMLLVVVTTVLAGGAVGWGLARARVLPGSTAAWGSAPGGAAAMVLMAEQYGADTRVVAFMQYLRVVVVTLTAAAVSRLMLAFEHVSPASAAAASTAGAPLSVPFVPLLETLALAAGGALAGSRLKLPAGALLVPMTLGAILHVSGLVSLAIPAWLLAVAYGALGWYIGLAFDREILVSTLRALSKLLLSTFALIGLCGLSAWMLTVLVHADALTAFLATSPGGLDSVAIIAIGSDANVPFVLAIQTLRIFIVIVTGPQLAKLISRYA
jgi:membrane AbrB-like protein